MKIRVSPQEMDAIGALRRASFDNGIVRNELWLAGLRIILGRHIQPSALDDLEFEVVMARRSDPPSWTALLLFLFFA